VVEGLPSKCWALSSNPRTAKKLKNWNGVKKIKEQILYIFISFYTDMHTIPTIICKKIEILGCFSGGELDGWGPGQVRTFPLCLFMLFEISTVNLITWNNLPEVQVDFFLYWGLNPGPLLC
jgi:hypothetical protein